MVVQDCGEACDAIGRWASEVRGGRRWIEWNQVHVAEQAMEQAREGFGMMILVIDVANEDVFKGDAPSSLGDVAPAGSEEFGDGIAPVDWHEL